jgi:hypothetical protein
MTAYQLINMKVAGLTVAQIDARQQAIRIYLRINRQPVDACFNEIRERLQQKFNALIKTLPPQS